MHDPIHQPAKRYVGRTIVLLFLVAAGLRVGWVAWRFAGPQRSAVLSYPDEEAYWRAARSLADGHGLVDEFGYRATYMPLFPALLAMFAGCAEPLLWARVVQALLGAWVAPATFLAGRHWCRWSRGTLREDDPFADRVGLWAGLAAACDPFLMFFSGLVLTETLFASLLMTGWLFVIVLLPKGGERKVAAALGVGVFLALAVMLRPSAVVLVGLVPIIVIAGGWRQGRRWLQGTLIVAVVAAALFPWALRNRVVIGQWRWLTTRGGISLYDGLHQGAGGESDLAHTKTMDEVSSLGEIEWDAFFRERAWHDARQDPVRVIGLAGRKLLRTWSLTPNVPAYRHGPVALVSAAWMLTVLGLAVVGLWRCRRSVYPLLVLLMPVATFTGLHMIFVGSVRYRVPVVPLVMVLAAVGFETLVRRLGRKPSVG